jgi:hypothetical protein
LQCKGTGADPDLRRLASLLSSSSRKEIMLRYLKIAGILKKFTVCDKKSFDLAQTLDHQNLIAFFRK